MMVLTELFLSDLLSRGIDAIGKKIDAIKPKDVQTVIVKQDPDTYSYTELDDATTQDTKWGDLKSKPDLEFENALEKRTVVKEITLIPDTAFKSKGKVIVTVDDVPVFKSKSFTAFEKLLDTTIQINKTIEQDSKVKVFMISSDGSQVGLSAQVTFGD